MNTQDDKAPLHNLLHKSEFPLIVLANLKLHNEQTKLQQINY